MKTFDDIEIRRPALAKSYLQLASAQPGRPLALFAPRRVGKTHFLDHDLTPAAKKAGMVPVYADLWLYRSAPLSAINHALEEALDDDGVPSGAVGRAAKTPVRKIGLLSASVEIGDPPARRSLPSDPELRLDALVHRLATQSGKPTLLMLDEIQTLGELTNAHTLLSTLRAVLQKRKREIFGIFTGSSQEALAAMMTTAGAPMYQFAQLIDFPALGDEYLEGLAGHFAKVHPGKRLDMDRLRKVFAHIGFKPALMKDLVKSMSAEGMTDIEQGLHRFIHDDRQVAGWRALLDSLHPFDKAVLLMVAQGHPPMGRDTLGLLTSEGFNPTISKVRASLDKLRKTGLLDKPAGGTVAVQDPLFAEYLAPLNLKQLG